MQSLGSYKQMGMFHVLRLILSIVAIYNTENAIYEEGPAVRYCIVSKQDKWASRAISSTYKVTQSAVSVLSSGRQTSTDV